MTAINRAASTRVQNQVQSTANFIYVGLRMISPSNAAMTAAMNKAATIDQVVVQLIFMPDLLSASQEGPTGDRSGLRNARGAWPAQRDIDLSWGRPDLSPLTAENSLAQSQLARAGAVTFAVTAYCN